MITSMDDKINEDLVNMETKLSVYVDKGRITGAVEMREEPVKLDKSLIKPLKKTKSFDGQFIRSIVQLEPSRERITGVYT
jgi:hypothetical protein